MSIIDFKGIDLKIEELYSDREKGLEAILMALKGNKDVLLTNIPSWLFDEIKESLPAKKVSIYTNNHDEIEILPDGTNYTSVEMKGGFNGREMQRGNIFVKNTIFDIGWDKTEIIYLNSFHFRPCIEDFRKTYEDILITEEVPVINYSTAYDLAEGVEEVKKAVQESESVRFINVPSLIVEEIYPLLGKKDFQIICAHESPFIKSLDDLSSIRLTRSIFNFYSMYKGRKMGRGLVLTDTKKVYSIDFHSDNIVSIKSTMWTKCSTFLLDNFKYAWLQAKKFKK
jgi:hypothetical protein